MADTTSNDTSTANNTSVPTSPGELTAGWITGALQRSGVVDAETRVDTITIDPGASGVGFMGEVASIELTYAPPAASAPSRLVAKFPTSNDDIRQMVFAGRIFEREHRFYAELATQSPLRTPEIFHVTCETDPEPTAERYLLLMEDLSGMRLADQVAGVTVDEARTTLTAMAGHHVAFWGGQGMEAATYIPVINGALNQAGSPIYDASLPGFMEAFGSVVRPELADYVSGYAAVRPQILDDLAAMPRTLVHFDFRADNLFFDDAGQPCVIDWQTISQGGGAADVGYFLSQNLPVEDRQAGEQALLDHYADELAAAGIDHYQGAEGAALLRNDYRVGVECGWLIPVLAVGSLDFTSERAVALWTTVIERTQSALIDLGVGA